MDGANKLTLTLLGAFYLLGDAAIAMDNLRQASFYSGQGLGREEFRRRVMGMPAIGIVSYATNMLVSAMPNLLARDKAATN